MNRVAVAASELGSSYDRVVLKLARLQVFVYENADAFERAGQLRVARSAAG
jgi:hypothetical protein